MPRVFDCAGSESGSPMTPPSVWPSASTNSVGTPEDLISQLDGWPLSTLRRRPYDRQRMTRGREGWLGLSRATLSFATPHQSPGALVVKRVFHTPNHS